MTPKLDTAGTLERIFEMYSRQFGVLLPAALIIYLPVAALQILARGNVGLTLVALVLGLVAATLFQGAVVQAVRDMQDGKRDFSVGEIISSAVPFIGPLLGASILYGLGVVAGLFLFVIPGLFLVTIWAVIAPVIVVEKTGILPAFGRSRALVKDNGWRVFGVLIVMLIITFVGQQVLGAIGLGIGGDVGAGIGFLIGATLTAPLGALTAAILYFTLKGLKGEAAAPPVESAPPADSPFGGPASGGPSPFGQ